jgi:site-specific DNA recombinase
LAQTEVARGNIRAVVYSRVSTDAQEREGTSLESQERESIEFAKANGWILVESFKDTCSGSTLDCPGIERLRLLLRQGAVKVVVAYAVDRLSRNQNHIGVLFDDVEQAGAQLQFVIEEFEDSAIGRFILAARAFIGEIEREKITERTMRGKTEMARSGKIPQAIGKGIYGYIHNQETGQREMGDAQSLIVRQIFDQFCSGDACSE